MKIALVIGHHEKSRGAYSKYFNQREWDFYKLVVNYVRSRHEVRIFEHDSNISGYVTRVKKTASHVNAWKADRVISLHFNAFNGRANGCETLYYYASRTGKQMAEDFSKLVSDLTGIKNRGIKALTNRHDRGFAAVKYTIAPTILIEPFFGDNCGDCEKIEGTQRMAKIISIYVDSLS
jgi:N-acetylmuramoyl-L-alanine amidase